MDKTMPDMEMLASLSREEQIEVGYPDNLAEIRMFITTDAEQSRWLGGLEKKSASQIGWETGVEMARRGCTHRVCEDGSGGRV